MPALRPPPGVALARPPGVMIRETNNRQQQQQQQQQQQSAVHSERATPLEGYGSSRAPSPVGRLSAEHECLPAESGAPTPPLAWPGDGGQQHLAHGSRAALGHD